MAFALALARGWRIAYFGADTPLETVEQAATQLDPSLVVLGGVDAERVRPLVGQLAALAQRWRLGLGGKGTLLARDVAELDPPRVSRVNPVEEDGTRGPPCSERRYDVRTAVPLVDAPSRPRSGRQELTDAAFLTRTLRLGRLDVDLARPSRRGVPCVSGPVTASGVTRAAQPRPLPGDRAAHDGGVRPVVAFSRRTVRAYTWPPGTGSRCHAFQSQDSFAVERRSTAWSFHYPGHRSPQLPTPGGRRGQRSTTDATSAVPIGTRRACSPAEREARLIHLASQEARSPGSCSVARRRILRASRRRRPLRASSVACISR